MAKTLETLLKTTFYVPGYPKNRYFRRKLNIFTLTIMPNISLYDIICEKVTLTETMLNEERKERRIIENPDGRKSDVPKKFNQTEIVQ